MATYDNSYSRFVAWVKIILPLIALALLSTLFLFSRPTDIELTIPYAQVEIDQIVREERISAPTYTGVTRDGSAISISAEAAMPDAADPRRMVARDLTARIETTAGALIEIDAAEGSINGREETATLHGGVRIETSTGYLIETEGLQTSLADTTLESDGAISATSPLGKLNAGSMHLTQAGETSHVLVFNDGVKLIYRPQTP